MLIPDRTRKEHGLVISEKIIPFGSRWTKDSAGFRSGDLYKADKWMPDGVKGITIHNTEDLENVYDDAEQYARATWPNQNMGTARVHYYIDDVSCWQLLDETEIGWHAGTGTFGAGNRDTISIEIIMDGSGSSADTLSEERGALLAAVLLNRYGFGCDRLHTHREWNGKQCPLYLLPHWEAFKNRVSKYLLKIKEEKKEMEALEEALKLQEQLKEELEKLQTERQIRYQTIGDVNSKFYLPTLNKLIRKGALQGRGGEGEGLVIDLSEDAVRLLVLLDRLGLFGENISTEV